MLNLLGEPYPDSSNEHTNLMYLLSPIKVELINILLNLLRRSVPVMSFAGFMTNAG